ncbi:hypothetical protein BX285_6339 [Streptomyces sp. 1114.5]|uniref:hypothetical protein n=1 Tax=unclassified Streptomyces TaxID=2593676 RepID=UPI000BD07144|nr:MULTISPECIES: hypothetical protein [unclassified Streptomyces]RKT09261.1 hypothetical protein BX285_6339 [Streptomyces sp. 1114.5]SOB88747.1 hypothetical protein SAMN06272789_7047 [Streptomyces sp. 1331.2]
MDAVLRTESALAWFVRATVRYLFALGCGWSAAAGGFALWLAHTGEFSGPEFLTGFIELGLVLFGWFGVPSLLLLLLFASKRESELHRPVVTVLWCGPPMFVLFVSGWALIGMLFQIGCAAFLLPAPRLRIIRRPPRP